jgi:hypothetical protein
MLDRSSIILMFFEKAKAPPVVEATDRAINHTAEAA